MDIPIIVKDGKPVFVGKEDPNNPPVSPPEGAKIECPVCHGMFDYLLGENANGGVMGCEADWKRPTQPVKETPENYDKTKEML